jgi:hypothetical protein
MGIFRTVAFVLLATWLGCGSAFAEKRVALVIGNSAYRNVPRLTNPANDAALVADTFRNAGFDAVTTKLDLTVSEMRKTLREFGASTREADIAVIYYAGHGIELDGNNYLIPTDAALETDADVLDETLPLDRVLFAVEPAKRLRLIILDACRDNPFTKTMKRTIAVRTVGRGLAKVEPTSPNTLIAFAAKAGSTALDGDDKGSPFTTALVKHIATPGLDLRKAFGYARDDVLKATNNKQEPYVYGSLGGDDVPLVPAKPVPVGPQPTPQSEVRRDFELALQTGDREAFEAFLRVYPSGFYADLARVQLRKIAAEEAKAAAEEKARQAQREKERLAAEGAKKAELAKAAAEAKAAEEVRTAAERAKQIEVEKAAAAERARAAAEQAAAEKLAAEKAAAERKAAEERAAAETAALAKAAADRAAAEKTAMKRAAAEKALAETKAELEKLAAEKAATEKAAAELAAKQAKKHAAESSANGETNDPHQVASLTPPDDTSKPAVSTGELAKLVQLELRRVGCLTGAADGDWKGTSQRSLTLFNKHAGTKFEVTLASVDVLDAIRAKPSRVCPLVCEHGFRADGDQCVKITCRAGYRVNDNNECEKSRKPPSELEVKHGHKPDAKPQGTANEKPQASGQMFCGPIAGTTARFGCRPLRKGCHIGDVRDPRSPGNLTVSGEVCD